ncbi:MAG: class I SAM-dependent methyltransferase [Planctomycetota bacterium]
MKTELEAAPKPWRDIEGWCEFDHFYREAVQSFPRASDTLVEVGVWRGRSLIMLAQVAAEERCRAKIVGVDRWDGVLDGITRADGERMLEELRADLVACQVQSRVKLVRGESPRIARRRKAASLAMVFLDADHTTEAVQADIQAWWPKVRPGGWLAGHDVDAPGVRLALTREFGANGFERCGAGVWRVVKNDQVEPSRGSDAENN